MYSVFQTYFTITWSTGAQVAASIVAQFHVVQAPIPISVKVYTIEHQNNNALVPPGKTMAWKTSLGFVTIHLDL